MSVNRAGEGDHEGDTSYIAVIDKDRNMVSFTPSLHSGFGTGVVLGKLGFLLNWNVTLMKHGIRRKVNGLLE